MVAIYLSETDELIYMIKRLEGGLTSTSSCFFLLTFIKEMDHWLTHSGVISIPASKSCTDFRMCTSSALFV